MELFSRAITVVGKGNLIHYSYLYNKENFNYYLIYR